MSRTGHRSVDSVMAYKQTTVLQELLSAILDGTTSRINEEDFIIVAVKDNGSV